MASARFCDSDLPLAPRASYRSARRLSRHQLRCLVITTSLLAFSAVEAGGQAGGTLRGVVSNSEKQSLAKARVSIIGTELATLSDSDGTFVIAGLPSGARLVEVRLLGYQSASLAVQIDPGKDAQLLVILSPIPTELEPVKVVGDTMVLPEMRGFVERRARGSGRFFTRDEIAKMSARVFTDVLRRVPGMELEARNNQFGTHYSVESARTQGVSGGRGCEVLYYLNGVAFPLVGNLEINSYIRPDDVAAVEIYNGASQIPPQFNSTTENARCGVVVIWTRVGKAALN